MQSDLAAFEAVHLALTVDSPPTSAYYQWWILEHDVSVTYLQSQSTSVVNSTVSNLISEFISSVQVVLSLTAANCTLNNNFMYFVIANHDVAHEVLQKGVELRLEILRDYFSTINYTVRSAGNVMVVIFRLMAIRLELIVATLVLSLLLP